MVYANTKYKRQKGSHSMIVSVTMNPSVDISYKLEDFKLNDINRVSTVMKTAGGKGLNVARVIHLLHSPVVATGILGGTIGSFIENQLDQDGIDHNFLKTDQESRNCIAILHEGNQTEILEAGPQFSRNEGDDFLNHYQQLLEKAEVVTISGSLPKGLDASIYCEMIRIAETKQIPVILDCSGGVLKDVLQFQEARPFAIKPNIDELNQLLEIKITAGDQLKKALEHPLFARIQWIVVSMGAQGAFVKHNQEHFLVKIPKINVVNPVGSGDSVVAGLAVSILQKKSREELMKTAMTAGVLNTMESQTGFVNSEKFDQIFNEIEICKVD